MATNEQGKQFGGHFVGVVVDYADTTKTLRKTASNLDTGEIKNLGVFSGTYPIPNNLKTRKMGVS